MASIENYQFPIIAKLELTTEPSIATNFGFGTVAGKTRDGLANSLSKELFSANRSKIAGDGSGHDGNLNFNRHLDS